jgi:flavodoxin
MELKALLVLYSYHHHNTEKVASAMAEVLDGDIKTPKELNPDDFHKYNLRDR